MDIFKNKKKSFERGFTLLELIVSIAIIGLITAVVVFNQKDFADQIALTNTSSDIELEVRQAQVYGVGVREFSVGSNEFDVAYGSSFNLNASQNGNDSSFITFTDRGARNEYYDGTHTNSIFDCVYNGTSECFKYNRITRNNKINKICVINGDLSEVCSPTVNRVDILFKRPSPEANFVFFNSSGSIVSYPNAIGSRIEIISPKNSTVDVYIYKTGQISVQ